MIGTALWIVTIGVFLLVHFTSARPETGPIAFDYHGFKMKIDHSDIDVVNLNGSGPFLRLAPNLGDDRSVQKVPYVIDLGRESTGKNLSDGYHSLGFGSYKNGEHSKTQLGDGYIMHCSHPQHQSPAFDCAVLLKRLPFAALEYRQPPTNVAIARKYVDEAERFLKQGIVKAND